MTSYTLIVGPLVSLVLFSEVASANKSEQKTAVLVEAYSMPRCNGLDCPPWPVPPDIDFCFQVGGAYYTGYPVQGGAVGHEGESVVGISWSKS